MLVIGSKAMRMQGVYVVRKPADIDIIGTQAELDDLQAGGFDVVSGRAFRMKGYDEIIDFELATPGSSAEAYLARVDHNRPTITSMFGRTMDVATPEILYSLKRSHRHMPKAWHKHIRDYHQLKAIMANWPDIDEIHAYDRLHLITELREREYMALKTPSLKKTAAEFFDDKVSNKVFVHDQIHEVMAIWPRPMYERIRKSPDTVDCSKAKWDELSIGDKVDCVLEEAYVIALERAVIPMMFSGGPRVDPTKALNWAIMRICTTLCSGWFRDFATEHYLYIEAAMNLGYHFKFFDAVDAGRIKRIG